jgi:hypothetical protein
MWFFILTAAFAQSLVVTGSCPGDITLQIDHLEGERVTVLVGEGPGAAVASAGPCGDLLTGLAGVRAVHTLAAPAGRVIATPSIPEAAVGQWLQAVDPVACTTSRAVPICPGEPAFIGTYRVMDGPVWETDPPTYSCPEACAAVFGGFAPEWACSTEVDFANRLAYLDGWGDESFCSTALPEHFKLNTRYNCGFIGCSYSAYVDDHGCESRNACFAL